VDWFTTNDVLADAIEVSEARWRTKNEPLKEGLVEVENVAPDNVICVYVVGSDLSYGQVEGCEYSYCTT